jgi:hypothetical protein
MPMLAIFYGEMFGVSYFKTSQKSNMQACTHLVAAVK